MSETDQELLHRFRHDRCDRAFAELVRRHVDLVYTAALRCLHSRLLAEDVVQAVFIELARHAERLRQETLLAAWLYQVTRRRAIDMIRAESRRRQREAEASELLGSVRKGDGDHPLEPWLDEAMESLGEKDRSAIILRFFEQRSLREVGAELGVNEDAAQKRVSRAVDRLRDFFAARDVGLGQGALASYLGTGVIVAAPAGLVSSVSAAVAATGISLATGLTQTAIMTTVQKTLVATSLTLAIGAGLYQTRQALHWQREAAAMQEAHSDATQALEVQKQEHLEALAALRADNERSQSDRAELARLRGEVAKLRQDANELASMKGTAAPGVLAANDLVKQANRLKEGFELSPDAWIPELALVTEEDWIMAAMGATDSEEHLRKAMSRIRGRAEGKFIQHLQQALKAFERKEGAEFPEDIGMLEEFLDDEIDPGMLDRWEVTLSEDVPNVSMGGDFILTQRAAVDDVFDQRRVVGPNGHGSTDFLSSTTGSQYHALRMMFQSEMGREPTNPTELLAVAQTESDREIVNKWAARVNAGQ